jgi:hypothetical protein
MGDSHHTAGIPADPCVEDPECYGTAVFVRLV